MLLLLIILAMKLTMSAIFSRDQLQDDPTEPTSTLVLTSRRRYFVDVRILLAQTQSNDAPPGAAPLGGPRDLEWAFAGTSTSKDSNEGGRPSSLCTWSHWVDSRCHDPAPDTGVCEPLAGGDKGDVLEKGVMADESMGMKRAYEEVWAECDVQSLPWGVHGAEEATLEGVERKKAAVVLVWDARKREDGSGECGLGRGMIVRVSCRSACLATFAGMVCVASTFGHTVIIVTAKHKSL